MEEPTLNHPSVKLVLVGEAGTGKTCIFTRLCKGKFDSDTSTSIGALGETITLTCSNNFKIKFNIWDTAGQEIYHSVNKIFYTDAKIVLIVYDVTMAKSFDAIKNYWYEQVSESCGKSTSKFNYVMFNVVV
jgi:small GTP-binding protein